MRTKVKRFLIVFAFLFFVITSQNKAYASETEASISATNCKLGENFTITVYVPQGACGLSGNLVITYSDGSTTKTNVCQINGNFELTWPGNYTVSFPAKKPTDKEKGTPTGNATVALNDICASDGNAQKINKNNSVTAMFTISPADEVQSSTPSASADSAPDKKEEPTPTLTFSEGNEKMYTVQRVNIRQSYGTSSLVIQTLPVGTELTRTGVSSGTANGYSWSRVSYNGITGYVITGALTTDAPAKEEETKPEEEDEKPEETTPEETTQNADELQKIADEIGTIPEVGVNIMPYMFIGSITCCLVMIYKIKFKKAE